MQHPAHLRGGALPLQLFFQRPARLPAAFEDAMAIGVGRERQAWPQGDLAEDLEVAAGSLFLLEPAGEHLAGRVVDGGMQDELWSPVLEPCMMTAVALHEHPGLGHAIAPAAVTRGPSGPRAPQSGLPGDTVDRGMGQREAFPFGQELAEVFVVEPGVGRPGEPDDPCAGGVVHAPRRPATAVPMDQGLGAVPAVRSAQAPDLTDGETQEVGRLDHPKLAAVQGVEHDELLLRTWRQGNHPPRIRLGGGRTFSLKS